MKIFFGLILAPFEGISLLLFRFVLKFDRLAYPRAVSERGQEVMDDPEKMKQVNDAVRQHNASGKKGPIVVEFK